MPTTSSTLHSLEPMQIDPVEEENENAEGVLVHGIGEDDGGGGNQYRFGGGGGSSVVVDGDEWIVENHSIDLENYVLGYCGLARLTRLSFIATHCPPLRVEALRLALQCTMGSYNTGLYVQLHKRLVRAMSSGVQGGASLNLPDLAPSAGGSVPATSEKVPPLDQQWLEQRSKKAALKLEKLDTDLKNYKSNSIKESIRRGHDDLGDHYLDCGDLQNALKAYSRARDYCTSGRHVTNMCLNVIKVSVYLHNWSHVNSYVNKAMSTPDFNEGTKGSDNLSIMTRLNCASGLSELAMRKYKSAAKYFLAANLDHCDVPDMMSTQNVAAYGGLCALATFDRAELHKHVIASSSFKMFLELDPQLREIIFSFYGSKYGKCLVMLEEMKSNLLLDLYLSNHVNLLYSMIRNRGLVQYFSPYLSADLTLMASCFNTSLASLEDELMTLILDGQIQARIDSHNKVLYAQDVDQRTATFEKALEMGELYQRRARLLILRSALLKQNLVVKGHGRGGGEQVETGLHAGQH